VSPTPRITGRPLIPEGYDVKPEGSYLEWASVASRLVEALHYWMATTRPNGSPHVVPRWGVWLDNSFWYDGSLETRHAINLRSNAATTLHLEDGVAATILDGVSSAPDPVIGELGTRLSAGFQRKYRALGYAPEPDAWSGSDAGGLLRFSPKTALAWSTFPDDLTRFSFE
jgi:hypothetical protein